MTFEMLAIQEGFDRDELLELSEAAGSRDLLYKSIFDYPVTTWAIFILGLRAIKIKDKSALDWPVEVK